jgi:hypothetical protein
MENPKPRRHAFTVPVLIILIGIHFLAFNLEWTDMSPWKTMLTLWPLLLVALGLDLLLRRLPAWISLLAALLFAALVVLLVVPEAARERKSSEAEWGHVQRVDVPMGKAESARIDLRLDAGKLELKAADASGGKLVEGEARLPLGARLEVDQDTSGPEGKVRIEADMGHRQKTQVRFLGERNWEHRWDLALARSLPLEVSVVVNAGTFDLDFSELNVRSAKAEINAGTGTLALSRGVAGGTAVVTVQAGTFAITVPAECAARIRTEGSLNTVRADHERFIKSADGYEAAGDGKGACRWEVEVHGNLSSLSLR